MPPSYRSRLRAEGAALVLSAALAALVLLIAVPGSREGISRTLIVLAAAALLIAWLGPRSVHVALAHAVQVFTPDPGSGEPRPLWHLPLVVAVPTVIVARFAGAANGLRLTLVLALLGLCQAFVLERIVAVNEGQSRRRYFRVDGSRMFGPTRLGFLQRRTR